MVPLCHLGLAGYALSRRSSRSFGRCRVSVKRDDLIAVAFERSIAILSQAATHLDSCCSLQSTVASRSQTAASRAGSAVFATNKAGSGQHREERVQGSFLARDPRARRFCTATSSSAGVPGAPSSSISPEQSVYVPGAQRYLELRTEDLSTWRAGQRHLPHPAQQHLRQQERATSGLVPG